MFGNELSTAQLIAVAIIPTLFAIVVHEVAHGWVAFRLGDDTAYQMGRLTLNPLKHIDPIGTILVPLVLILTVGFAFGWAKPVPVNFNRLHNPRRDTALVAVAGPASNLLMAIGWAVIVKLASLLPGNMTALALPLIYMGMFGMIINAILMAFNLIPIPPTDGGRIAISLLPPRLGNQLSRLEPYGLLIILLLLLSGILWRFLDIVTQTVMQLFGFLL
jgi:Zn-dependent protease